MFTEEEQQREVAQLFNTKLEHMGREDDDSSQSLADMEKAFHDIVMKVKQNSYEYHVAQSGRDIEALSRSITAKKELEVLAKTHISLE